MLIKREFWREVRKEGWSQGEGKAMVLQPPPNMLFNVKSLDNMDEEPRACVNIRSEFRGRSSERYSHVQEVR